MNMATIILKEDIANVKLIPATVDNSHIWLERLVYAVRLGNAYKGKTAITFNTEDGEKTVETTVWSLTDRFIQLKGGVLIPLSSIVDVEN